MHRELIRNSDVDYTCTKLHINIHVGVLKQLHIFKLNKDNYKEQFQPVLRFRFYLQKSTQEIWPYICIYMSLSA